MGCFFIFFYLPMVLTTSFVCFALFLCKLCGRNNFRFYRKERTGLCAGWKNGTHTVCRFAMGGLFTINADAENETPPIANVLLYAVFLFTSRKFSMKFFVQVHTLTTCKVSKVVCRCVHFQFLK
jgi:hypothetical protein